MNKISGQEFKASYGGWALVAGAAEGIGEAFSTALAKRGMNLVMVDLNAKVLNDLAGKLKETHGIMTKEIVLDLSEKDAWQKCMNEQGGAVSLH